MPTPAELDPIAALEEKLALAERRVAYRDRAIAALERRLAAYRNRRVRSVPQEEIEIVEQSLRVAKAWANESGLPDCLLPKTIEALDALVRLHREAGDLDLEAAETKRGEQ